MPTEAHEKGARFHADRAPHRDHHPRVHLDADLRRVLEHEATQEGLERIQDRYREGRIAMQRVSRELQSAYLSLHMPTSVGARAQTAFIGKRGNPADRVDFNCVCNTRRDRDAHESDQVEVSYFGSSNPERGGHRSRAAREHAARSGAGQGRARRGARDGHRPVRARVPRRADRPVDRDLGHHPGDRAARSPAVSGPHHAGAEQRAAKLAPSAAADAPSRKPRFTCRSSNP